MNIFLSHVIKQLTSKLNGIQAIILRGSYQSDSYVDFWSDFDILVVLDQNTMLNNELFLQAVNNIGEVIGNEIYKKPESTLYRSVIVYNQSIHLLDASICTYNEWLLVESISKTSSVIFGSIEIQKEVFEASDDFSFEPYKDNISGTWFKYFVTIKKIARNDNLIGLHLILDLIREYLVLEMIERDIKHRTNIHRFGYQESLPENIKLSLIDELNKEKILDYIDKLANEYDKKLMMNITNYKSRYSKVSKYIEETKRRIVQK